MFIYRFQATNLEKNLVAIQNFMLATLNCEFFVQRYHDTSLKSLMLIVGPFKKDWRSKSSRMRLDLELKTQTWQKLYFSSSSTLLNSTSSVKFISSKRMEKLCKNAYYFVHFYMFHKKIPVLDTGQSVQTDQFHNEVSRISFHEISIFLLAIYIHTYMNK